MKNEDIYKYFGECINSLVNIAKQKINEANEKIEKEQKFKQESKESRDNMQEAINHINEVLEYDLTTSEGYSKYMEYLADLRKRVKEYNNIIKLISGQTAEEMIDDIAQKATDIYMEAKKKQVSEEYEKAKEAELKQAESEMKSCTNNQGKNIEDSKKKCEDCQKDYYGEPDENDYMPNPSELVDDFTLKSVKRIVNNYTDESLLKLVPNLEEDELEWLKRELVEYTCWIKLRD